MIPPPPQSANPSPGLSAHPPRASANPRSIAIIVLAWLVLHIGCLFTPGLLDNVDSIYIEIARSMLLRHDYVTPMIDGIRFFDKPPLMYWLAAGSMHLFGPCDWAARLPLALLTLALLLATYALGLRLFAAGSPSDHPDRAALYSALALATCIGPFLYTRFFIPDIVICLWMALAVHAFLIALDRTNSTHNSQLTTYNSSLLPCLIFAAVTALNLLTKGIIGLVFPIAFVLLYLALSRQLRLLLKLHLIPSTLALPPYRRPLAHPRRAAQSRHRDARRPRPARPRRLGLVLSLQRAHRPLPAAPHPARLRPGPRPPLLAPRRPLALSLDRLPPRRNPPPHPRPPQRWTRSSKKKVVILSGAKNPRISPLSSSSSDETTPTPRDRQTALTLLLWAGLILVFFTFSARQEYYSLPAVPALALMIGGLLARADRDPSSPAARSALAWHRWLLVPLCSLLAAVALFFAITAPHADPRTDIASLLSLGGDYNLSLAHLFDLTGRAMGLFRAPLAFVALGMIVIGPLSYILRRPRRNGPARTYAANLTMAAAAVCLLLSMHEGLVRFYPTLGSKGLAEAILQAQRSTCNLQPATCNSSSDLILIDGELTSGSTLLFYTRQPAHFVNGRVNGAWYGSFWPDAPAVFDDDASLDRLWAGPRRIFLLTYTPAARTASLSPFGPVRTLASAGGKSILTNR